MKSEYEMSAIKKNDFVCGFVYAGHSDWCEMVPHCGLICISLMASDAEHLFTCLWACLLYTSDAADDPRVV